MINLFSRTTNSDLVHSRLYNEKTFYKAFSKDLKKAKREVVIESPFMTISRTTEILSLCHKAIKRGVKIKIYTRNPKDHSAGMRMQAYVAIKKLRNIGVKVKVCNDLRHRKISIIDRSILWEGSLNMLSHRNSKELMRRTESARMCRQIASFVGLKKMPWW